MGLLDSFNFDDPRTLAILNAAAQMGQQSGPSLRPTSIGQILGGGFGAFNQSLNASKKQKQDEEEAAQMKAMRQLQMRGLTGELADKDMARKQAIDAQEWYRRYNQGRVPDAGGAQLAALPELSSTPMQSVPGQSQPFGAAPAQAPGQAAGGGQGPGAGGIFQERMRMANAMRASGIPALIVKADEMEKTALQFQPKVKNWEKVTVGDRVLFKPYFEDGSHGEPVAGDVAEKLSFHSTGQNTVGLNPFTGAKVSSIANTQSPDSLASNGMARERLNFDKSQAGRPVWNNDVGAFITPPSATQPRGSMTTLEGYTKPPKPMTEDQGKATGWLVQAENAFKNMQGVAYDKNGGIAGAARPGFTDAIANIPSLGIGGAIANTMRSEQRQKFMQGASSLSESLLRAATGAGVNRDEAEQKVRELTPVMGDSDATIKQKFDAIPLYIESLKVRAGPGAALAAGIRSQPAAGGWGIEKVNN